MTRRRKSKRRRMKKRRMKMLAQPGEEPHVLAERNGFDPAWFLLTLPCFFFLLFQI